MAIFAVFRVTNPEKMNAAMHSPFPDNHLQVGPGEWLVSAPGTAKEISDKLGVTGETTTGVLPSFLAWQTTRGAPRPRFGTGKSESGRPVARGPKSEAGRKTKLAECK